MQIQDQNHEINVLRRSLGITENKMVDVPLKSSSEQAQEMKKLLLERDDLKNTIQQLQNELKQSKLVAVHATSTTIAEELTPSEEDNKYVYEVFQLFIHFFCFDMVILI